MEIGGAVSSWSAVLFRPRSWQRDTHSWNGFSILTFMRHHLLRSFEMASVVLLAIIGLTVARSSDISVLARLPTDADDSTIALRMWGKDGLLVRAHSIWSTHDEGRRWELTAAPVPRTGPRSFEAIWLRTYANIFALSDGSVFCSSNQGREWTRKSALSTSAGIFEALRGDDGGTWTVSVGHRSVPIPTNSLASIPKYANDIGSTSELPRKLVPALVISDRAGTWKSVSWTAGLGPLDRVVVNGSLAVALGPYIVLATADKGSSWFAPKESGISQGEEEAYPLSAAISQNQIWVSLKNGVILTGDISKREITFLAKSKGPLDDLTFVDSCVGYALRDNELVLTPDGGRSWQDLTHSKAVMAFSISQSAIIAVTHDQVLQVALHSAGKSAGCIK